MTLLNTGDFYGMGHNEMLDALVDRWLMRVSEPLEPIVQRQGPAGDRLRDWLMALHRAMLDEHVTSIIADGVGSGEFLPDTDPARAARAVLSGSLRFHHPMLLAMAPGPPPEQEAEDVFNLLVAGLKMRHVAVLGVGALGVALGMAWHFGGLHGGGSVRGYRSRSRFL